MKKSLKNSLTLLGTTLVVCGAAAPAAAIPFLGAQHPFAAEAADTVDLAKFTDPVIRAAVESKLNGNTAPTTDDLAKITSLGDLTGKKITKLDGIEYLTGLTDLNVSNNGLTAINVSKNTKLTSLNVSKNKLTTIDVSKNTSLDLTKLTITENPILTVTLPSGKALATGTITGTVLGTTKLGFENGAWTFNPKDVNKNFDAAKATWKDGWTYNATTGKLSISSSYAPTSIAFDYQLVAPTTAVTGTTGTKITHSIALTAETLPLTGLDLVAREATLDPNGFVYLQVIYAPINATNKNIVWKSSDTNIATVDINGKVTAKTYGTATITASSQDGTKITSCTVMVPKIAKIALTPLQTTITTGKQFEFRATLTPHTNVVASTINQKVNWAVSDTKIATVDTTGKVTGLRPGTVTLTATTEDGKRVATSTVIVTDITSVAVTPATNTIPISGTVQLSAAILPTTATNKNVTWTTSDPTIAAVDNTGKVTGLKLGQVTITATTADGQKTATAKVTVSDNSNVTVSYQGHVQSIGWQPYTTSGMMGTTGSSRRIEAIRMRLSDGANGGIEYQAHIQGIGWKQNWRANGAMAGTSGQSRRIEAIRIRLTGQMAQDYDIYYRSHVQSYGWLTWAKNGGLSGTTGKSKRMEALEIRMVKKGSPAP